MTVPYACDCMCCVREFRGQNAFKGGKNVKPEQI